MTLEIQTNFRIELHDCLSKANAGFKAIRAEFSSWEDQKGKIAQEKINAESSKYKAVSETGKSVLNIMREIEIIAEKVESISRKNENYL